MLIPHFLSHLEKPAQRPPGPRCLLADIEPTCIANGFIGWVFSATAPVAIILAEGSGGGLSEAEIASWIFGVFFINGLISILMSWAYRQPLGFAWTIPGTVLVGSALTHLPFAEVVGAFYATGILILVLGATGWVKRAMQAVSMPIVMGMVAGVFLRFGLDLMRALHSDVAIAAPMVIVWLVLAALPRFGRRLPPMIGALLVGGIVIITTEHINAHTFGAIEIARPVLQTPVWSLSAMMELVLPLSITVLVVQSAEHDPPMDAITLVCGIGTIASAMVGSACSCLTGPTNAILTSSGERSRQYIAGITFGVIAVTFGLLSPAFTRLMLGAPKAYIMTLAGLAMLRVLQGAFIAGFRERFSFGALIALLVTVADIGLWNIGAPFWGLLAGLGVSWLLERQDFTKPPRTD